MTIRPWQSALVLALLTIPGTALAAPDDAFSNALAKGPLLAGLAAFGSGFLVSLTPCVYPMVAVTVSVFGAKQVSSRVQGALLSATFVAGIVVMFVSLGVGAALTGSLAGGILQNRWVIGSISALFLAMAAAMFGAFELDLPSGLKNRLAQVGGSGYPGAFVLGLACGPIAAPCTGPFLTGILAWIAKTQNTVLGALAMAAFALGLGVPFFLVGAFAVQLPKSGRWMMHVKSVLGLILIGVALFFLNNAFGIFSKVASPSPKFLGIMAGIALFGIGLGAIHKSFEGLLADKLQKGAGVLLTSVAATLFVVGLLMPKATLTWQHVALRDAREKALGAQRPLIVDFGAAWCTACKELDKVTFSRPDVREEAGRFMAVKVDATNDEDPQVTATMGDYKIVGLPTVLVFDSKGNEAIRYTDFVEPDQFLAAIKKVN